MNVITHWPQHPQVLGHGLGSRVYLFLEKGRCVSGPMAHWHRVRVLCSQAWLGGWSWMIPKFHLGKIWVYKQHRPTMIWLVNVVLCFISHGKSQVWTWKYGRHIYNQVISCARSNCWWAIQAIPHIFLTCSSAFDIWPPLATHISTNIKPPGPNKLAWHSVKRLPGDRRSLPITAPAITQLVRHLWYLDRWQLLFHSCFQYVSIERLKLCGWQLESRNLRCLIESVLRII